MQYTLRNLLLGWHFHSMVATFITVATLLVALFLIGLIIYGIGRFLNKRYVTHLLTHYLQPAIANTMMEKRFITRLLREV